LSACTDPRHLDIRFSGRIDVQHRTAPLETAVSWLSNIYQRLMSSRLYTFTTVLTLLLSFALLRFFISSPLEAPRPDLIKVAAFARSFEPLIYYSENGVRQLGDLQETGTAVWDLSESVRAANLTSSSIIVSELDSLGESLKALTMELTGFFASVDGDFDNILLVMDWARRELSHLSSLPSSPISSALTNLHNMLSTVGLLDPSEPTSPANQLFDSIFGVPGPQRVRLTLQRTFLELLGTLEDSIASELAGAQALFSLYSAIDRQFLNLQRATVREFDAQDAQESEVLASLWARALGGKAAQLRKFEKNKRLLGAVRSRTTVNKGILLEHNGRLVALKQNLEMLRRRLVGPLLRVDESATGGAAGAAGLGLEEQVRGLEETGEHLRKVRQGQKERVMETLFGGGGAKRGRLEIDGL